MGEEPLSIPYFVSRSLGNCLLYHMRGIVEILTTS